MGSSRDNTEGRSGTRLIATAAKCATNQKAEGNGKQSNADAAHQARKDVSPLAASSAPPRQHRVGNHLPPRDVYSVLYVADQQPHFRFAGQLRRRPSCAVGRVALDDIPRVVSDVPFDAQYVVVFEKEPTIIETCSRSAPRVLADLDRLRDDANGQLRRQV